MDVLTKTYCVGKEVQCSPTVKNSGGYLWQALLGGISVADTLASICEKGVVIPFFHFQMLESMENALVHQFVQMALGNHKKLKYINMNQEKNLIPLP